MRGVTVESMQFDARDADGWFSRNAAALTPQRTLHDPVTASIHRLGLLAGDPLTVCELGASNGWRLAGLSERYPDHRYIAVDLSADAVRAGAATYPHIQFLGASALQVPLPDASVDRLILSYVMHWIDRDAVDRVVHEVHRLLRPGGHLILSDFWPDQPIQVPYHHRSGVWTYKQDYRELWKALGYTTADVAAYPDSATSERCMVAVLGKEVEGAGLRGPAETLGQPLA